MKKVAAVVVLLVVMVVLAFASISIAASPGEGPDGWNDGRCGVSC